ncbi:MAG TPA: DinB family protein [Gemmatimonadales bacterium]|nr:DinB family protein [Gemmatimonadales bacterium]
MIKEIQRLWFHAEWADLRVLAALKESGGEPPDAWLELGHVLGAAEVWLARLQHRPARLVVWPTLGIPEADQEVETVHAGYRAFLADLEPARLEWLVQYTNSAGQAFENSTADILLHVVLHGQYHRGKVNLRLRHSGHSPAPCDYIAFIRGSEAARTPPPR